MIAWLIFLISLIVAFRALHGWPSEANEWIRALIALASLLMGAGVMVLLAPSSKARRFQSVRRSGSLDRLASGVCIALAFGLFYFILVLAPPTTRQFSDFLITAMAEQFTASGKPLQEKDLNESDQDETHEANDLEIRTLFDPDGALVPKSANLNPSDDPQVSVIMPGRKASKQLQDAGQIYLHAFSHNAFDGERWTTQSLKGLQKLTQNREGLIHLHASDQAPAFHYKVWHHEVYGERNTVSTLQGVRYVRLPEITQINPGTWFLPPIGINSNRAYQYEAGSTPRQFGALIASGIPIQAGDIDELYLAPTIHSGLHLQIQNLATRFQTQASLEKRLVELQNWLSNSFTYSRVIDYPDNGECALESFLGNGESREGFCVHFASVAALLLRELGIASRVSYGWTGGEYYREHDQFVFRGAHGHAWAEMFLKDYGWVVFETTPSSALPQSDLALLGANPPVTEEQTGEEENSTIGYKTDSAPSWRWMLIALGVGVTALFMLLALKQNKLARSSIDLQTDAAVAPPGYLRLFYQACIDMGHPKPSGCTLLQYLKQLDRDNISAQFAEELLTYHYNVTYREVPRDARVEKHLCKQIKAL